MLSYSDQNLLSRIERRITALEEALAKLHEALADMQLGLRAVMGQAGIGDVMMASPDGLAGTGSLSPPKTTPDAA